MDDTLRNEDDLGLLRTVKLQGRVGHAAHCLGGDIIIFGGCIPKQSFTTAVPGISCYNIDYAVTKHVYINDCHGDEVSKRNKRRLRQMAALSGSATTLVGNTIYVFGGYNIRTRQNSNVLLSYEVLHDGSVNYRVLQPDIEASPMFPSPRDKHGMVFYNNCLYTFGGYGVNFKSTYLNAFGQFHINTEQADLDLRGWNDQLLIYDFSVSRWFNVACTGRIPSPRAAYAMSTVMNNDQVYLFGGRDHKSRRRDMFCLNLSCLQWTKLTNKSNLGVIWPCARSFCTLTRISDDLLFFFGGMDVNNDALQDAFIYSISQNSFRLYQVPEHKRLLDERQLSTSNHRSGLVEGGDHFVDGEKCTYYRMWHATVCSPDRQLYIIGGSETSLYNQHAFAPSHYICIKCKSAALYELCIAQISRKFAWSKKYNKRLGFEEYLRGMELPFWVVKDLKDRCYIDVSNNLSC